MANAVHSLNPSGATVEKGVAMDSAGPLKRIDTLTTAIQEQAGRLAALHNAAINLTDHLEGKNQESVRSVGQLDSLISIAIEQTERIRAAAEEIEILGGQLWREARNG